MLFLITAFFSAAGLFVLLGAEFLAMILVVVYVGAVAVLFLFVVMMLDVDFAALRAGLRPIFAGRAGWSAAVLGIEMVRGLAIVAAKARRGLRGRPMPRRPPESVDQRRGHRARALHRTTSISSRRRGWCCWWP